MHVKEIMSSPPETCRPSTPLWEAASTMQAHNRGCLPVVDGGGRLVGMITDRDVCLTVVGQPRNLSQTPVRESMTRDVLFCAPDDSVERALAMFAEHGVRRLPVVDSGRRLRGVLSLDDLVRHAGVDGLAWEAVLRTLQSVYTAETGSRVRSA